MPDTRPLTIVRLRNGEWRHLGPCRIHQDVTRWKGPAQGSWIRVTVASGRRFLVWTGPFSHEEVRRERRNVLGEVYAWYETALVIPCEGIWRGEPVRLEETC